MLNSTTKTYTLKREILTFSNKISKHLTKPERKFTADMTYGLLASGSCRWTWGRCFPAFLLSPVALLSAELAQDKGSPP